MTEIEKLREWYKKELEKRDKLIDTLKRENQLLMKTSIKQSEKTQKWVEYVRKVEKHKRAGK